MKKLLAGVLMVTLIVILYTQGSQYLTPLMRWFIIGVSFLLMVILFGDAKDNSRKRDQYIKRKPYEDTYKKHIDDKIV